MTKFLLDFVWFILPEWLGTIIKNVSGGWVLAKCYDPEQVNKKQGHKLVLDLIKHL